jgi:hypothetical protein
VNKNKEENNETANSNIITQQNVQVVTTVPVNRMINISYQGSQVQPPTVNISNQRV